MERKDGICILGSLKRGKPRKGNSNIRFILQKMLGVFKVFLKACKTWLMIFGLGYTTEPKSQHKLWSQHANDFLLFVNEEKLFFLVKTQKGKQEIKTRIK